MPAPDFPTGGLLIGKLAAKAALARGRGSILMRARCHVEEIRKDREALSFSYPDVTVFNDLNNMRRTFPTSDIKEFQE